MKLIENTFEKYKTTFNLIKRVGNFAIFSRQGEEFPLSYEVVEILSHNGMEIAGNWIEPKEFLPSNEQWGTKGFSYLSLVEAEARLNKMVEEDSKKVKKNI